MKKIILLLALSLFFSQNVLAQFSSVKQLKALSLNKNTKEKPQSKVWMYDGKHFAVLSNNNGMHVFRLDNDSIWTNVFTLTSSSHFFADCKVAGNVVHVLLFDNNQTELVSLEYVPSNATYKRWTTRTSSVGISTDSDAETATIDIDATGRMWMAYDTDTTVSVRWSDSPYSSWSAPIIVASGINPDDIGAVIAFPMFNKVGVFWSNQNTERFGFRMHSDSDPDSVWSADENPASQSALNVGHGFSDDHMNFKVGSNGTLYCAVKTSYDTPGYTKISLLVRRPNGTWDNIYKVSELGTRGIVLVNELKGKIRVIYTEDENGGDIFYRESSLSSIAFGPQQTLISGSYNNPTSIKNNHTFEVVIIASNSSQAASVLAVDDPPIPDAPTLDLPVNGTTSLPVTSSFSWVAPLYAKTYQLQVATNSTFQNIIYDGSNITNTSSTVPGLSWSTQYYWRVRAVNKSGSSAWSVVRNFTTEAIPMPAVPVLVSPVNGATQVSNPPVLSWNAANYATTYQLQVATSSGFQTIVSDVNNITALTLTVSNLNWNTQYFWRVRSVNASGNSSWSTVRSFTMQPIPMPGPPVLASPSDSTINVVLPAVLTWNAGAYATTYQLQVAISRDFLTISSDITGISALTKTVSGLDWSSKYFWRVRSINASGTSAWSDTSSFISEAIPVPAAPTLVSPANSAINIPLSTTLSWNAATYAQSYQMQLATSPDFLAIVKDSSFISSSNILVSGLNYSTQYYWRIRATNTSGSSSWSVVRSFTTVPPLPIAPVLVSPADVSSGIAIAPTLSWNASAYATSYQMQLSTSSDFLTTVSNVSNLTTLNTTVSGLAFSTQYFWRVRATNITGTSSWSEVRSFTTIPIPIPAAPALVSPANGATGVAYSPTLSWNAVTYAETYQMQLATTSDFLSPVADVSNLTTLNTVVSALAYSTQYFWRVRAINTSGAGNWSTIRNFKTVAPPPLPGTPSLSSPSSGSTGIAVARNFSWKSASNAYYYQIQFATVSNFATIFKDSSSITTLSVPIAGLSYSTKFYWRVRAINTTGAGNWSKVRNFTTVAVPAPAAPVLDLPANAATAVTLPAALSWNAVLNAASYQVQVATSSGFSNLVSNVSNISSINTSVNGLNFSTQYFWRVRATNASGTSSWSAVRSFTTEAISLPGPPTLASPVNNATAVLTPVGLNWNAGSYGESYQVQVATATDFLTPSFDVNNITTLNTSVAGLAYNTLYYWRVRTNNASGASAWSAIWSFTTGSQPATLVGHWEMEETSGTTLNDASSFNNHATTVGNPTKVAGVYGQALQLNGTSQYATVPSSASLNVGNAITLAAWIKPEQTGNAQVILKKGVTGSADGYELSLTSTSKIMFRYNQVSSGDTYRLLATTLHPTDGNTWMHIAATFDGASLKIYVNGNLNVTMSPSSPPAIGSNNLPLAIGAQSTGNNRFKGAIDDPRVYNVALSAADINALATMPTFRPAPEATTLTTPADNASNISLPVTLSWSAVTNAVSYQVQVAPTSDFVSPAADISNITDLNTSVSGLNYNTQYFWRVRAVNSSGESDWSAVRKFTTEPVALPGPPTLSAPANNATAIAIPAMLSWTAGTYASTYQVQVATASDFLNLVSDENNITTLSTTVSGLAYNTQYFWRVRTVNSAGTSSWTIAQSFTTKTQSTALVGYWEMEETGGTTLFDASANANDATTTGNPIKVAGVAGQALLLNGTNQYATVPSSTSLNISNAITLAAWIKPEQSGSAQVILKKGLTGNADGYELSLTSTRKILFRYNQVSGGSDYKAQSSMLHPTDGDTWMHIAGTFDGTTIKIYIDGVLDKTETLSSAPPIATNNLPLAIGAQSTGNNLFKGAIDEPKIYNVALNSTEISSLANISSARMAATTSPIPDEDLDARPNPFMNTTRINFTAPENGGYSVNLYNIAGNLVKVLKQGNSKAGEKVIIDLDGSKLPRGLYLVRLQTNKNSKTLKLVHDHLR